MSVPKQCCQPCPDTQTENIPGPEGADGAAGEAGVNAFTFTTAGFIVPAVNATVLVSVLNSTWMVPGQKIVFPGPATFEVVSTPDDTSALVQFMGYVDDVLPGASIASGSKVSPSGTQPVVTLLPPIDDYALAGAQAVTTSFLQGLNLSVTLPDAKSYLLIATARFDFDVATFPASEDLTVKLVETFNGPLDIADAIANAATGVRSAISETFLTIALPSVVYAAAAGDVVELQVSLSDTPYTGALNMVEGSILAIPLF